MTNPLIESESAVADSNGRAVVTLQPLRAFENWHITRVTVQSSSTTKVPTAKVYRGDIADNRLIDGTYTGTLDHTDTNIALHNGERFIVVWIDADAGANCTVTVEGTSKR